MMSSLSPQIPQPTHHKHQYGQLYGGSRSLAVSLACQHTKNITLLITPDHWSATQLHGDLNFFLQNTEHADNIFLFPDWETLPYDPFSPHEDLISERLKILYHLQTIPHAIVIAAVSTLMHRLCPQSFLNQHALILKVSQKLSIEALRNTLQDAGYRAVNTVLEHGEFAVRGSIIDLFPMGSPGPYRIDLFDDCIDELRRFDPETQRTIDKIQQVHILPAREFPLTEESIRLFRRAFREQFVAQKQACPLYEGVSLGQAPHGIEYYLPLFFTQTATLFDYLPDHASIGLIETTIEDAQKFWNDAQARYEQRQHDLVRPVLPPNRLFLNPTELYTAINAYGHQRYQHDVFENKQHAVNLSTEKPPALTMDRHNPQPLAKLLAYLNDPASRCLLVVESAGRREVLCDLLLPCGIKPTHHTSWQTFLQEKSGVHILIGALMNGIEWPEYGLRVIVEAQIFGEQPVPQRRATTKAVDPDLIIRHLAELHIGAPVVHIGFGVGRYQGLKTFENGTEKSEFLVLHYASDDKIYVPITSLHLISRYTGADSDHAPLHRLGSEQWQKDKKKAAEKIHDVAIELLDLYAKREACEGQAHTVDWPEYHRFVSEFPFIETIDQTRAVEEILHDMQSRKPMDRLICGDVGFGKTEVAMRAAFVAVQNGQQVCVLVPTTLLAGQHFESFRDRFADFPINIGLLSRFRSDKEVKKVLDDLASGHVDIVIGTHKLFQKSITYKNLGLLIIDEEHRFGVKQKEHIKSIRMHVDTLCMTATPIPRTLNMAMAGIRDISLITTPPAKRLSIKTFWQERENMHIREALLREILRGGQVFFLHNNVKTIAKVCLELQALVPEAHIVSAHGQMRERDLERIMSDFYHHRFNVLVCTTIIETGIDIPTANTIIIDQADQFGLAQLHQLRGRVGRSHHQAYAYLLTKDSKLLTRDAVKRLDAIVSLEDLGAGFILATHDLEIRGAGDLLGEDQSGNMHAIGFNLYMDMLNQAVQDLKSGKSPSFAAPMHVGPEIDLRVCALIPDDYMPDVHTRLTMYKRITHANADDQRRDLQIELIDRFGLLPAPLKNLFTLMELKAWAEKVGIKKIHANATHGTLEFEENPCIDPAKLIQLIQLQSTQYQLQGPTRLRFVLDQPEHAERIMAVMRLLQSLYCARRSV